MRRLLVVVLACLFAVVLPGTAWAHDVLERTTPANGTIVPTLPESVRLTLSDEPLEIGTQVVITGPEGPVSEGAPTLDGRDVVQGMAADAPAGDYTVTYRVTSSDGHPISGTFGFHATIGRDGSTATAGPSVHVTPTDSEDVAAAKESQFVPVLLTVVGVILVGLLLTLVFLRGRARTN